MARFDNIWNRYKWKLRDKIYHFSGGEMNWSNRSDVPEYMIIERINRMTTYEVLEALAEEDIFWKI